MLSKSWKRLLIATLSVSLLSCAGKPPDMERPIKYYGGIPSRKAMCRNVTQESMTAFVQKIANHSLTRNYAQELVAAYVDQPTKGLECIPAEDKKFATLIGLPADDLRVLLQHIENLVYKCQKWKQ